MPALTLVMKLVLLKLKKKWRDWWVYQSSCPQEHKPNTECLFKGEENAVSEAYHCLETMLFIVWDSLSSWFKSNSVDINGLVPFCCFLSKGVLYWKRRWCAWLPFMLYKVCFVLFFKFLGFLKKCFRFFYIKNFRDISFRFPPLLQGKFSYVWKITVTSDWAASELQQRQCWVTAVST